MIKIGHSRQDLNKSIQKKEGNMKYYLLLVLFISVCYSQNYEDSGNLVKIHYNDVQINEPDNELSWLVSQNKYLIFYSGFTINEKPKLFIQQYDVINSEDNGIYFFDIATYQKEKIVDIDNESTHIYYPIDKTTKIENGIWYTYDNITNLFCSSDEKIYKNNYQSEMSLLHILGKFEDNYLIIYTKDNKTFKFGLSDLQNSPNIEPLNEVQINSPFDIIFTNMVQLNKTTVLFEGKNFNGLDEKYIYNFTDNKFNFESILDLPIHSSWYYANQSFYLLELDFYKETLVKKYPFENNQLGKAEKIFSDTNFVDFYQDNLQSGDLLLYNETDLILYSYKNESVTNQWNISGLNLYSKPIICSPNIFIPIKNSTVDVNKNMDEVPEFFRIAAYPNPFNPKTTIEYQIPISGKIRGEIFNSVGEKILTIIDEYKEAGNYKAFFNADNLTAGIYFCKISHKQYSKTIKLVLLK